MRTLSFCRKFNFIRFFFKAFVNTIGTFGSKSTENKGLMYKIHTQGKKSAHSAERRLRNTGF